MNFTISGERNWVRGSAQGEYYVKDIVDSLTKIQGDKYKYDPYVIEDKIYTWLQIPLIVKVEHYDTFVEGLKTLHKAETCKIIEKDGQLFVSGRLGAGPLHFYTFSFAKLTYIEQLVTIKASLNYCKFNVNFSVIQKREEIEDFKAYVLKNLVVLTYVLQDLDVCRGF